MKIGKRILIKSVVAKIPHSCSMCGDTIAKSEHYTVATAYNEDKGYMSYKCCLTHEWKEIHEYARTMRDTVPNVEKEGG